MDRLTAAKVFIDISHSGSFTASAKRLEMSRPMVTRYIETMEDWLKVRLLHRTTRKVTLTTAGKACLKDVEAWLSKADSLSALVKPGEELSGNIRISTTMSFSYSHLVPALVEFMNNHPKVNIDLDVQDAVVDLLDRRIDLAIRIGPDDYDTQLAGKPIGNCASVLVASTKYLEGKSNIETPSDLSKHNCLGYGSFDLNNWYLTPDGHFDSKKIKCRFTANEATSLLHAALNNGGISILPTYLVNSYIANGQLQVILPDLKPKDMKIYALYSSRKHLSQTVKSLIDHLEMYIKKKSW